MKQYSVEFLNCGSWEPALTFNDYARAKRYADTYPDPLAVRISEVTTEQARDISLTFETRQDHF